MREAIAIAERLGWSTLPIVGVADLNLAAVLIDRGQLDEGEDWLERAEPILTGAPEPAANVGLHHAQGMLAIARGRFADALAAFRDGERLAERLRAPHFLAGVARQWQLRAQLRLGDAEPARAALAEADGGAQWCSLAAHLRLAEDDAAGAAAAVAPVLAGRRSRSTPTRRSRRCCSTRSRATRSASARRRSAASSARSTLAEPQGHVWIVLTVPGVRELLAAHPAHRTAHAAHLRALLDHLEGVEPRATRRELADPLSERELAVLRFLPTNLSAAEIGSELFLSVQHGQDPHAQALRQARRAHARGGGGARAGARAAGAVAARLSRFTRIV